MTPVTGQTVSASDPIQYPSPQHCLVDAVLAQYPSMATLVEVAAAALDVVDDIDDTTEDTDDGTEDTDD